MTHDERFELDIWAMQSYDCDSSDVERALRYFSLDPARCTTAEARDAVRRYALLPAVYLPRR